MRIAVVEDDDGLGDALVDALTEVGHTPVRMRRGADALLGYHDMDVVLLDLGLPDMDGLEVLRKLRTLSSVPVVVLTARDDERSVVRALRGGADDYVVKPARLGELHARLEVAAHRRSSASGPAADRLTLGDVVVDLSGRAVEVGGRAVALTTKEFDLLAHLVTRRGEAVSREQLMDAIWGDAYVAISRTLDVHMTALRSKLDRPGAIVTIRGFGYRWDT
ncbi:MULTISPECIES: response regulator transcription factor [Rhodococcus]|jgi:DNA-binding response OmpR family regulator|uniref:Response regulator transcription factor n=1 Tax=Rhodococcus cercidiphylli TaxID=489916 RepID=A0ABU4AUV5_9NOCA|nr:MULTISPECIES: response regulator transcription factor [Rhodococcus]MDV6229998.1 response regulator transcription factor [Rhodococcus cercidiphylli]OZE17802.1 DNA-binding response regulator [Rhodococcus sp. 05-2254-6]OZE37699.1 DNA-binding response regulator [Rhodococcus sp. 05-2254-4]OZE40831.1 DNA-binding response regulator [Rhodococcus sp. 05-2254-3]OZE45822.1 DNA-binding response regulator [Rhodococcus sp. 05-2254-2]